MDTNNFKEKLLEESAKIVGELKSLGREVPVDSTTDWEAVEPEVNRDRADEGEVADNIEQYESNSAVLDQLEKRLSEVKNALAKIEAGTYGKCEISGEDIELDRLEANPAARTCKKHMG